LVVFLVETRRSFFSANNFVHHELKNPQTDELLSSRSKKKKKKTNMGGKDDEGNNDSGSDDDIAFADDDNDTKDEETNVESYDSDDENLEEVSFMLSIFLYRHLIG
jgi:hypothetical protein